MMAENMWKREIPKNLGGQDKSAGVQAFLSGCDKIGNLYASALPKAYRIYESRAFLPPNCTPWPR